jgi:cellulose synthase/poly-beta-1,6-N-acetylglucosamine synthase-like glycosyltransferase
MTAIKILYWACIALILYHHIGYPLLLKLIARCRPSPTSSRGVTDAAGRCPSTAIIIPCHNEASVIARKIENIAQLDYPRESISVVLVLDGCTDDTRTEAENAIARLSDTCRWRIADYRQNLGKVAVLNEEIAQTKSEIVALSDASAIVSSDALLRAATHFCAPDVGVVCGTYVLQDGAEPGEQAYWAYQRNLKMQEARAAAPMGAHGAFYLFRRRLWERLPPDTINDDFILPMRMVRDGYRAVYDENIVATELEKTAPGQDFRRRVRIGAGNMQQFLRLIGLGDPRHGLTAFVFLSGKGLRALMPFILAAATVLSAVLAGRGEALYAYLFAAKIVLFLAALLGSIFPAAGKFPLVGYLTYAATGHAASGWGAILLLTGKHTAVWKISTQSKSSTPFTSEPRSGISSRRA